MDRFHGLPSELRLEVLLNADNPDDAKMLGHSSPAMLDEYHASRGVLSRHFLEKDLAGDLIQDALAILRFPTAAADVSTSLESRGRLSEQVHEHMEQWTHREFRSPFETRDDAEILKLETLFRRTKQYMDDYLSKATASFLPLAYLRLPDWSHESFAWEAPQRLFNGQPRSDIHFYSLNINERRRLLQAFLRYEIMCRVYHPLPEPYSAFLGTGSGTVIPAVEFSRWDWHLTHRNDDDICHTYEIHLMQSVHEYYRCLYGALAAQITETATTLPQPPPLYPYIGDGESADTETPAAVFFPESLAFNPGRFIYPKLLRGAVCTAVLASLGLDLITTILTSPKDSWRRFLYTFWTTASGVITHQVACRINYHAVAREIEPALSPALWVKLAYNVDAVQASEHLYNYALPRGLYDTMLRMYRQRAWALFDDGRFYPEGWDFPKMENLINWASEARSSDERTEEWNRDFGYAGVINFDDETAESVHGNMYSSNIQEATLLYAGMRNNQIQPFWEWHERQEFA